jgi:hypothetical protein
MSGSDHFASWAFSGPRLARVPTRENVCKLSTSTVFFCRLHTRPAGANVRAQVPFRLCRVNWWSGLRPRMSQRLISICSVR